MLKQFTVSLFVVLVAAQRLRWQGAKQQQYSPFTRAGAVQKRAIQHSPECSANLPDALSFIEPLDEAIRPDQVVIFTGGDSLQRRSSGFPLISAESITEFAQYHGYGLVFLDQVDYDKTLMHAGIKYHAMWHRIFALPSIRKMFPQAKYFIQIDDDILIPYKETDIVNHYINMMEKDPEWYFTYGEEPSPWTLNAGFFIMKNMDFCFDSYKGVIEVGLENNARLSNSGNHEQEAMVVYRRRHNLENKIRVIGRRSGRYNFNTFAREARWDKPETVARMGDSIIHFTGQAANVRVTKMNAWKKEVEAWRQSKHPHCMYPLQL